MGDKAGRGAVPRDPAARARDGFLPLPRAGRVFTGGYPIRRADVTPDGRMRFDAVARYLQDVAEDDLAEAGLREPCDWLVRRYAITRRRFPQSGHAVRPAPVCSGGPPPGAGRP